MMPNAAAPLAGKVALVTGCARPNGIGRAIAVRLAAAGADVVVADYCRILPGSAKVFGGWEELQELATTIVAGKRRALPVRVDVTREDEVVAMVAAAVRELGGLDILCNNAGGSIDAKPVVEQSLEGWTRTLAVNVTGAFLCAKHAAPVMVRGGRGGRIVNTASILAKQAVAGAAAYVAGKHALLGLTRTLALELGPLGITCNAVCPGEIATDARPNTSPTRAVPVGRLGLPGDVAEAVAYLVSDEAAYVNGQSLAICGGVDMS